MMIKRVRFGRAGEEVEYRVHSHDISRAVSIALEENRATLDRYVYRGAYHTPLWTFTRVVKSILPNVDARTAFAAVNYEIEGRGGWDSLGLDEIMDRESAYVEFVNAWDKIRYKSGNDPVSQAICLAEEMPLRLELDLGSPGPYSLLVSYAGWLQVASGDGNITLPCRLTGDILGVSAQHVSRMIRTAILDEYLTKIAEYPRVMRKATEYRFDVSRFPELRNWKG